MSDREPPFVHTLLESILRQRLSDALRFISGLSKEDVLQCDGGCITQFIREFAAAPPVLRTEKINADERFTEVVDLTFVRKTGHTIRSFFIPVEQGAEWLEEVEGQRTAADEYPLAFLDKERSRISIRLMLSPEDEEETLTPRLDYRIALVKLYAESVAAKLVEFNKDLAEKMTAELNKRKAAILKAERALDKTGLPRVHNPEHEETAIKIERVLRSLGRSMTDASSRNEEAGGQEIGSFMGVKIFDRQESSLFESLYAEKLRPIRERHDANSNRIFAGEASSRFSLHNHEQRRYAAEVLDARVQAYVETCQRIGKYPDGADVGEFAEELSQIAAGLSKLPNFYKGPISPVPEQMVEKCEDTLGKELHQQVGIALTPVRRLMSEGNLAATRPTNRDASASGIDVFISHSSQDRKVAEALIRLLRNALSIPDKRIRCTSVPGYMLEPGSSVDDTLRREIHESTAFIGLITPSSLQSTYVLFELGARWGAGGHLVPALASGADASVLQDPLKGRNAVRCYVPTDVHDLIANIAAVLKVTPGSVSAYQADVETLVRRAKAKREEKQKTENPSTDQDLAPRGDQSFRSGLEGQDRPKLVFEVGTDRRSTVRILHSDESLAVYADIYLRFKNNDTVKRTLWEVRAAILMVNREGKEEEIPALTTPPRSAVGHDQSKFDLTNGMDVLAGRRSEYFHFNFGLEVGKHYAGRLDDSCFLRVTMEAQGQDLFSADIYPDWKAARQTEGCYINPKLNPKTKVLYRVHQ